MTKKTKVLIDKYKKKSFVQAIDDTAITTNEFENDFDDEIKNSDNENSGLFLSTVVISSLKGNDSSVQIDDEEILVRK